MGRRHLGRETILLSLAEVLEEEGVTPGKELPRDFIDREIIRCCGVGPDSVANYLKQGEALGYWDVVQKHGRGGRGHVVFLGTKHELAVA